MNDWLLQQRDRRLSRRDTPAGEYAALTAQRTRADATGDSAGVEAIDARIDELFATVRQSIDDEKRQEAAETSATMRFSSGVRRPIRKQPSPSARMDQMLLQLTGRSR